MSNKNLENKLKIATELMGHIIVAEEVAKASGSRGFPSYEDLAKDAWAAAEALYKVYGQEVGKEAEATNDLQVKLGLRSP